MSDLAERLAAARRDGTSFAIAEGDKPADADAAYALQAKVLELLGWEMAGWKIGFTNADAQAMMGHPEPAAAPMPKRFCVDSPATVRISTHQSPAFECEFALKLDRDLPPRAEPYGRDEVAEAVAAVAGAVEVVGARTEGPMGSAGGLTTIADGVGNVGFVAGPWHGNVSDFDLAAHNVTAYINGAKSADGEGAKALGHPFNVLEWLANRLSALGQTLKAGEPITTGTCTGILPVKPGDSVVADFGPLGKVEITFATA